MCQQVVIDRDVTISVEKVLTTDFQGFTRWHCLGSIKVCSVKVTFVGLPSSPCPNGTPCAEPIHTFTTGVLGAHSLMFS